MLFNWIFAYDYLNISVYLLLVYNSVYSVHLESPKSSQHQYCHELVHYILLTLFLLSQTSRGAMVIMCLSDPAWNLCNFRLWLDFPTGHILITE